MSDDLAALLAEIESRHLRAAQDELARHATKQQIARLNAITPRRGGADLAAGEREDDDDDTRAHERGGIDRNDERGDGWERRARGDQDKQTEVSQPARPPLAAEAPPHVPGLGADPQRSPEVDPYTPPASLYSREWLAEFWQRLHALYPQMDAAIEGMHAAIQRAQEARR